MGKFNKKRFYRKTRTKELKPKDGYSRFKFMGKVFRYREEDIHIERKSFSGDELVEYGAMALDENGFRYDISFYKINGKYVPFAMYDRYGMF